MGKYVYLTQPPWAIFGMVVDGSMTLSTVYISVLKQTTMIRKKININCVLRVFRTCFHIQILNDISYANIWYKPSQKSSAGSVDRCCCSGCLDATDIFSQTARQSQPRKVRVATYCVILLPDIQLLRKNIATLCGERFWALMARFLSILD